MTPPLLKLAFVKGPREGESLEYKPGSTIRIGRVVRGNEIAVKDAGISTKHLRIVSDSENWIIHDLGSSNGTVINSETLDPDTPVTLRDGDEIKLGEYTSFVVNFEIDDAQVEEEEEEEEERKLPPRPRRNTRRAPVSDPDPIQEKPDPEPPKRTRATRSKVAIAKEKEEEKAVAVEKKVNSTRGDKKNSEAVLDSMNSDPDPVPDPEPPKRARATRSKVAIAKEEEGVAVEKKVNSRTRGGKNNSEAVLDSINSDPVPDPEPPKRAMATRSKGAITKEEEESVAVEKKVNTRARGGKKKTENDLDSVKLEVEDTPKRVEILVMKRETRRSRKIGNVKSEDTGFEEIRRATTRSKRKEIGGDSFLELDMVLSQARAKRKKMEHKNIVKEMEARDEDVDKEDEASKRVEQVEIESRKSTLGEEGVEEDKENEMDVSDKEDEEPKRVETESGKSKLGEEDVEDEKDVSDKDDEASKMVEIESRKSILREEDVEEDKEDGMDVSDKDDEEPKSVVIESGKSTLGEDGEAKNLQDVVETSGSGCGEEEEEEKAKHESMKEKNVENVDLRTMTLGDWFKYMEVYLRKKIVDETEEMIEAMRAKSRRVHQYIAEHKGKEKEM